MIDIKQNYEDALAIHEDLIAEKLIKYRDEIVSQINHELLDKVSTNPVIIIRFIHNSQLYFQALSDVFDELINQGYYLTRDTVQGSYQGERVNRFIFELLPLKSSQLSFNFKE